MMSPQNGPETRKPNLFIVGAPRCGTTAWVSYLSKHPDIYFSPAKEPHYFCTDFPKFRWVRTLEDYQSLFSEAGSSRIVGEASVQYLYSKVAAQQIRRYHPNAKILIFLRPHAEFLASYHNQLLMNRDETLTDFSRAWRLSGQRDVVGLPSTCREAKFLDYKAVGELAPQVSRYLELFPREQVKILWFPIWTRNPRMTYLDILDFLELDDDGLEDFHPIHFARQHNWPLFGNLTQRPPNWILRGARAIKWLLGRERLGAAHALRKLNTRPGYVQTVSTSLKSAIDSHFENDRRQLKDILGHECLPGH